MQDVEWLLDNVVAAVLCVRNVPPASTEERLPSTSESGVLQMTPDRVYHADTTPNPAAVLVETKLA